MDYCVENQLLPDATLWYGVFRRPDSDNSEFMSVKYPPEGGNMESYDGVKEITGSENQATIGDQKKAFYEIQTFLEANGRHYSALSSVQVEKLSKAVKYFRDMADKCKASPREG